MSTTASDSSQDTDLDARRSCPHCATWMSSLAFNGHKFCSGRRGQECIPDNKCMECRDWPPDVFDKYVKHMKSLVAKSKARKSRSDKDSKKPSQSSAGSGVNVR